MIVETKVAHNILKDFKNFNIIQYNFLNNTYNKRINKEINKTINLAIKQNKIQGLIIKNEIL